MVGVLVTYLQMDESYEDRIDEQFAAGSSALNGSKDIRDGFRSIPLVTSHSGNLFFN